jgi:ferritin-like metal-binding protein YciE
MKTTIEKPKSAAVQPKKAATITKKAATVTKKPATETKKAVTATKKPEAVKAPAPKGVVKAKPNAAKGLRDFFEDGLKDIYWAEKAMTKALPKMAKNATAPELVRAFENHLVETEEHVARLERVFESLGLKAVAVKCDAMAGLVEESKGIMEETEVGEVRDAALIAAAQKVEHYEIATYGTLRVFAATLGESKAEQLLAATLEEEKNADVKLTEIAVSHINADAVHPEHKSWFDIFR